MGFIKRKHRPEYATVQREWAMWGKQMEKTLPGYGEQNEALHWMVRILTGVRVLYCLFYLIMTFVYGMEKTNAVMTLLGPFIFYGWYMLMLRESPVLTVLMLIGRGASIVWGGVSLLQMSWWLPFPLVFMLVMAALVVGAIWGLAYRLYPQKLGALIVSHAVWDVAVFVVFPI